MKYKNMIKNIARNILPPAIRRSGRRLIDSRAREMNRLRNLPRRHPTTTDLLGDPVHIIDAASFLSAYQSIYENEIYAFQTDRNIPKIIDGGANIGLATLYWKRQYPEAQITAFEPSPEAFRAMSKNIEEHNLENVNIIQKGLWRKEGSVSFNMDGADGGHFDKFPAENKTKSENVPVTRLCKYIDGRIDMLKLDIEGAEVEVILDSSSYLSQVKNLFVEYHSYPEKEQRLNELLSVLRNANFRVHLQPERVADQPFIERPVYNGKEHTVNIFAYRQ